MAVSTVHRAPPSAARVETETPPSSAAWRAWILPGVALAWLIVGGVAWGLASRALADRIWFVGLVLLGAPVVLVTVRQALRGQFATDLVATLAIVTAAILAHPLAGLVVLLMQTGGEALDKFAEGRASAAVRALEEDAPRIAHRLRGGGETAVEDVPVDDVDVDDLLLVRPGEMVPCDGVVVEGFSHVDTSRLTGEPLPLQAEGGVKLMSGSLNLESALTVRATALAGESQYARIVELVRSAQASKAPLQRLADRYAVWFTPITLLVCAVAFVASGDWDRVLAVLVVATPCPLILATPVAIIGGVNRAARAHVVVRTGGALEQLAAARVAIFDKTGTLTVGTPEVSTVVSVGPLTERELLRLAAAVEHHSGHLLGRSVVAAATAAGVPIAGADGVREDAGRGVRGIVDGRQVSVGATSFVAADVYHGAPPASVSAAEPGLRAWVVVDGRWEGYIEFADRIRDGLPAFFRRLRELGITRTLLLSGDSASHTEAVAREVGIADARGELLPGDKVSVVKQLVDAGERVLMVGDGTNDAPALSAAHVGVALAAHGGGITAEAADVVILTDDVTRVADMIQIGRRTLRIARQSIRVGLGVSAIAMLFAALGYIPPVVGAALQEALDVAVILNALRTSR
ncbi:MAG TPA: heavy metal translocating P-type ATPase [Gemmatimonadaceae bacterium]|nr:heavy metal translocating P-type ATPase [Gemmatimonadaceae bacterium]